MSHPRIPSSNSQEEFSDGDLGEGIIAETENGGGENSLAEKSMRRLLAIPRRDSPDDASAGSSAKSLERRGSSLGVAAVAHEPTEDTLPLLQELKDTAMDVIFPSTPEKIYNLMFTSGFMREFWVEDQKLMGE